MHGDADHTQNDPEKNGRINCYACKKKLFLGCVALPQGKVDEKLDINHEQAQSAERQLHCGEVILKACCRRYSAREAARNAAPIKNYKVDTSEKRAEKCQAQSQI